MIFWTHTAADNRRRGGGGIKARWVVKAVLWCALVGSLGVGYVGLKQQIFDLSASIAAREAQLKALRDQNAKLARQLDELRSPPRLHARVMELRLGLQPPQEGQRVRLPEPAGEEAGLEAGLRAGSKREGWPLGPVALRQP